jgi:hypothetical protein
VLCLCVEKERESERARERESERARERESERDTRTRAHAFVETDVRTLRTQVALVLEVDQPEVYINGGISDGDYDRHAFPQQSVHISAITASTRALTFQRIFGSPVAGGGLPRAMPTSLARGVAPAPHVSERASLLQLAPSAMVNKSRDDASFTGLAVVPSRALLEGLVCALGFEATRVRMRPHPTMNVDVHTYTRTRLHAAVPKRFFLRCVRPAAAISSLDSTKGLAPAIPQSLEDAVLSEKGHVESWHRTPTACSWWAFRRAGEIAGGRGGGEGREEGQREEAKSAGTASALNALSTESDAGDMAGMATSTSQAHDDCAEAGGEKDLLSGNTISSFLDCRLDTRQLGGICGLGCYAHTHTHTHTHTHAHTHTHIPQSASSELGPSTEKSRNVLKERRVATFQITNPWSRPL